MPVWPTFIGGCRDGQPVPRIPDRERTYRAVAADGGIGYLEVDGPLPPDSVVFRETLYQRETLRGAGSPVEVYVWTTTQDRDRAQRHVWETMVDAACVHPHRTRHDVAEAITEKVMAELSPEFARVIQHADDARPTPAGLHDSVLMAELRRLQHLVRRHVRRAVLEDGP